MNHIQDALGEVKAAFQKAATNQRSMVGIPNDAELSLYEKMNTGDFKTLEMTFGLTDTAEWIKRMEAKRAGQPR